MIRSETEFIFSVTRTQLFGPEDLVRVEEIRDAYALQHLSAYLGTDAPPQAATPDFPEWVEGSQFDERFFGYLDFKSVPDGMSRPAPFYEVAQCSPSLNGLEAQD